LRTGRRVYLELGRTIPVKVRNKVPSGPGFPVPRFLFPISYPSLTPCQKLASRRRATRQPRLLSQLHLETVPACAPPRACPLLLLLSLRTTRRSQTSAIFQLLCLRIRNIYRRETRAALLAGRLSTPPLPKNVECRSGVSPVGGGAFSAWLSPGPGSHTVCFGERGTA
jgi:hypothetical protein